MKKKGTIYEDPDGSVSYMTKEVKPGIGDCVIYKKDSLYAAPCDVPVHYICESKYD